MSPEPFVTCEVSAIRVGDPLPVDLYVFLSGRFITFRAAGDVIDRQTFDRLQLNKVQFLFARESQVEQFRTWCISQGASEPEVAATPELKSFQEAREDVHRKTMDIFLSE